MLKGSSGGKVNAFLQITSFKTEWKIVLIEIQCDEFLQVTSLPTDDELFKDLEPKTRILLKIQGKAVLYFSGNVLCILFG